MNALSASNLGHDARPLTRLPVCGYSPKPNDPTVPLCNRPAAAHIKPLNGDQPAHWTIFACHDHADLAYSTAFDAHPYTALCSQTGHTWIVGTSFTISRCVMPREVIA